MATTRKAPGDVTGRASANLAVEHQKELAARANELALLNAVELEQSQEVIDVIVPTQKRVNKAADGTEQIEVDQPEETVLVQIAEDITDMTWGAGNFHSFKAGQRANLPRSMANWLAERGYIWGM